MRLFVSGFPTLGIMLSLFWHIPSNGEDRSFGEVKVLEMVLAWGFLPRAKRACRRPSQMFWKNFTFAGGEYIISDNGQASAVPWLFFFFFSSACLETAFFFFFNLYFISPHFGDPEIQVWFGRFCWTVSLGFLFVFSKLFEGLDIFCTETELSRLPAEPSVYCSVRSIGVISKTQITFLLQV